MGISYRQFKVGNITKQYRDDLYGKPSIDKEVEVWKTYIPNSQEGRLLRWNNIRIWPSVYVDDCGKKTFIYLAPSRKTGGHAQDLANSPNGYQFEKGTSKLLDKYSPEELDPVGGAGTIRFISKESSLWYPVAVKIHIHETNKVKDNTTQTYDNDELFQFPTSVIGFKYDKYDEDGQLITDMVHDIFGNIGYSIQELENEKAVNDDVIDRYFKVEKTEVNTDAPLDYYAADFQLEYTIGPNNNTQKAEGYAEITHVYIYDTNGDGSELSLQECKLDDPILIASWSQKANCAYYCSMAWVKKPSSYTNDPVRLDSTSVSYNSTSIELYLYVEFGASPDGGTHIYWNQTQQGLDATLPDNLYQYITVTPKQNGDADWTSKYSSFVVEKYGGNYFKVTGTSSTNNGQNNESTNRKQTYKVENLSISAPYSIQVPYDGVGPIKDFDYIQAANADQTDDIQKTEVGFYVNRYTSTDDWSIQLVAELNYGKYQGSTNGQSVG